MRRRKAFLAASFIVTAGVACQNSSDPETIHANPPPQPEPQPTTSATATSTAPTPTATGPIMNPPPPTADDDPTSNVHIIQGANGKCLKVVTVTCPKGVMCNPPPPQEVPCPPDAGK